MAQRILTVDDDPDTTASLKRLLTSRGFEVREENDSTKALETARGYQPDFVILDFDMPKVHGGDLAWQIASDPLLHNVKVIICSAVSQEELRSKLPPARIPILAKPVDSDALVELLRSPDGLVAA